MGPRVALTVTYADRCRVEITWPHLALVAIVCLGVGLRVAYFTGLGFSDDPDYAQRAFNLLHGREYLYLDNNGLRVGTWYPAAIGYALFGVNHVGLVAYPLMMSTIALVVIATLGTVLFNRLTGLIAALLLAFYPLDVELSTRLLPDALLSAWSLIAVYFLFSADLAQEQRTDSKLRKPWMYFVSGALLGWCLLVNMSAIVLVVFVVVYFVATAMQRWRASSAGMTWPLFAARSRPYVLLGAGFCTVLAAEAVWYWLEFGSFLAKYSSTLAHYNDAGRAFFRDLWLYPENMFFLRRDWTFQLPPPEYRPYGFFFIAALPSLIFGLVVGGARFRMVALWGTATFAYLQWGTMSVSSWNLLHRLDRHLELVTPPMVLITAFAMAYLVRTRARVAALAALAALCGTSIWTMHERHAETESHLAVMAPIHSMLEVLPPSRVFMDTQTIAYQKFLHRYQDRGWQYEDIDTFSSDLELECLVIVHSDNPLSNSLAGVDPSSPPSNWRPLFNLAIDVAKGGPKRVRAFRVSPRTLPSLDLDSAAAVTRHVQRLAPSRMPPGKAVIFYWEGLVDGVERIELRARSATTQSIAFQPARDVIWRSYLPVVSDQDWHYEVIVEAGRGKVSIADHPMADNGSMLAVDVDDGAVAGASRYRWFVIGGPGRRKAPATAPAQKNPASAGRPAG